MIIIYSLSLEVQIAFDPSNNSISMVSCMNLDLLQNIEHCLSIYHNFHQEIHGYEQISHDDNLAVISYDVYSYDVHNSHHIG